MYSQVFESIVESSFAHVDRELLQEIDFIGITVEPHLAKPCEGFRKQIFCFNQSPGYGTLVNKHVVDVFKLSTKLDSVDRRAEFTLIEKELKLKKRVN